jgi:hypothetical protein
MNFVTSGSGAGMAVTMAWTTPFGKDTGVKVRVTGENSQMLRGLQVKNGEAFSMGEAVPTDMMYAVKGFAEKDGGPWQARIYYPIAIGESGYAVAKDSGIKTPKDIKPGTRIIYITFVPIGKTVMEALLAWGNIDPKTIEWVPAPTIQANTDLLKDGKGDVAFGYPQTPYWMQAEAAPRGLAWITLDNKADPTGADRFVKLYPWFDGFAPMTQGPPSAKGVLSLKTWAPYITRAESDNELVFRISQWLDKNYSMYKDAGAWSADMTVDNLIKLAEHNFTPLHDGTVRYLQGLGKWTDAHEKRQQLNIANMTKWVDGYKAAMKAAQSTGIPIDPNNEAWINFWEKYKNDNPMPLLANFQKGLG